MKEKKNSRLAVYLDHSKAVLLDCADQVSVIGVIESGHGGTVRFAGEESDGVHLGNYRATDNEHHKHQIEQNELHKYYTQIIERMLPYDELLILGPTTAKNELANLLALENRSNLQSVSLKATDALSPNQISAEVRNHFLKA